MSISVTTPMECPILCAPNPPGQELRAFPDPQLPGDIEGSFGRAIDC